jgi:hypothetical protein
MDREHRKRTRVSVHFEIKVTPAGETTPILTEMVNMSLTGVLCATRPLFEKGGACRVILNLSDDSTLEAESVILRVGRQHTAISFISMGEDSFSLLRKIIQYNTEDADAIDRELVTDAFAGFHD